MVSGGNRLLFGGIAFFVVVSAGVSYQNYMTKKFQRDGLIIARERLAVKQENLRMQEQQIEIERQLREKQKDH